MHGLAAALVGVSLADEKPYVVLGFAVGGVYALSGVGMVVLYRATGVLNLAFGSVGAAGALISWYIVEHALLPAWLAYLVAVAFGGVLTLAYGVVLGRAFADRDPLIKTLATLGLALVLLGTMAWRAPVGALVRIITLPTSGWRYDVGGVYVTWTQVMAFGLALVLTVGTAAFLRFTKLGTAMRALADDREITAMVGVPVRSVEAAAWLGSGFVCGAAGLLLADLLGTLDYAMLTFLVIWALSAALIGRLWSLYGTLAGGLAIGWIQALLTPIDGPQPGTAASIGAYRSVTPFVLAIAALLYLGRRRVVTISRSGH